MSLAGFGEQRTRSRLAVVAGLLAAAASVLATSCGGSTDQPLPQGWLPESEYGPSAIAALCDNLERCCSLVGAPYDRLHCQTLVEGDIREEAGKRYDGVKAAECVAAVRQTVESCIEVDEILSPCNQVYSDAGPHGQPGDLCSCTADGNGGIECGGSTSGPSGPATCYRNEGVQCGTGGRCQTLAEVGEPCALPYDCADGTWCDNSVCSPLGREGDACNFQGCATGFYCDDGTSTCFAQKPTGAACLYFDECQGSCEAGVCADGTPFPDPLLCGP